MRESERNRDIAVRIVDAINAKVGVPGSLHCPLCRETSWAIDRAYVPLATSRHPGLPEATTGYVLPLASIVCENCGNTHLINLLTLGFTTDEITELVLAEDGTE